VSFLCTRSKCGSKAACNCQFFIYIDHSRMLGRLFARLVVAGSAVSAKVVASRDFTASPIHIPIVAYAEELDDEEADLDNDLEALAAEMDEESANKDVVNPPIAFENVDHILGSCEVDAFDGARMQVQKRINLNTVVSHFYWLGSSMRPSLYRYSMYLIDPIDDTRLSVYTEDLANVNGDINAQLNPNVGLKANFSLTDKGNTYTTVANIAGQTSNTQFQFAFDPANFGGNMFSMAYMQAVTKCFTFGGQSMYVAQKGMLINTYAGVYDDGDNCFAAQYNGPVSIHTPCII
jgi:hypothetical protein